jgi:hypothetical protein
MKTCSNCLYKVGKYGCTNALHRNMPDADYEQDTAELGCRCRFWESIALFQDAFAIYCIPNDNESVTLAGEIMQSMAAAEGEGTDVEKADG